MTITILESQSQRPTPPRSAVNTKALRKEQKGHSYCEEHNLESRCWLNCYTDMKLEPTLICHYNDMSTDELATYKTFLDQVHSYAWEDAGIDARRVTPPPLLPDDITCLRFLQADKYDTIMAMQRVVNTLKWQKEYNLARIVSTKPEKLDQYRKIRIRGCMGMAKDGMPVLVERLGHFLCAVASPEGKELEGQDYVDCFLYDMGHIISEIRKSYEEAIASSRPATWNTTWIIDCKGMKFYSAFKAMSTIRLMDAVTEPNFPELAGPVYLVNAGSVVAGLWKIAKTFLNPNVVAKIQIHPGVPTELLLSRIDESVLFEEYGGSNTADFPKPE